MSAGFKLAIYFEIKGDRIKAVKGLQSLAINESSSLHLHNKYKVLKFDLKIWINVKRKRNDERTLYMNLVAVSLEVETTYEASVQARET